MSRPSGKEQRIVGHVLLAMWAAVVLSVLWKLGHHAYRELIRRRQVAEIRAVLGRDVGVIPANQTHRSDTPTHCSDVIKPRAVQRPAA